MLEATGIPGISGMVIEMKTAAMTFRLHALWVHSTASAIRVVLNPGISSPAEVSAINHITNVMLQDAPLEQDIYPKFI